MPRGRVELRLGAHHLIRRPGIGFAELRTGLFDVDLFPAFREVCENSDAVGLDFYESAIYREDLGLLDLEEQVVERRLGRG